ncbi:hypothetical protein BKA83DRAFT_4501419 [Pisolithus microcarpus]|nr:hypothetical protein BKA83DRAFT_4501419 [Pisolithus microcarpus]
MSQQLQSMGHQTTAIPSWDLSQVPDDALEVLMDDSEGTKQAKEAEKGRQEAVKREHQAEEQEQQEQEEQRAKEVAKLAASSKGKGMGSMPLYSPMTGAKISKMAVPIFQKQKKKCSWVAEDQEALTSGTRKQAGPGCLLGEKKKRGWSGAEDKEVDKEVGANKGSEMSVPCFEAAGSCLIGERELRHGLPPDDKYHRQLLVAQEEQAIALEWCHTPKVFGNMSMDPKAE